MLTALALALAAVLPAPATPAPVTPAPAAPAAVEAEKLSIESTVAELLASPETRAVLEKHIPAQLARPEIAIVKSMKLRTVAGYRQANISPETLQAIADDLAKL